MKDFQVKEMPVFSYEEAPQGNRLKQWIEKCLPHKLNYESKSECWERYAAKFTDMGGIVEEFIEASGKRSPSVQCRIDPLGNAEVISTHDQVLSGPTGQMFIGCTFPADDEYRSDIQQIGEKVAELLRDRSVLGRFGLDFISKKTSNGWKHYAIEINLRKGGTTHPFIMLQFLTDGTYDPETGLYRTPSGEPRFYYASDNVQKPSYIGLTPEDLTEISVCNNLHFHGATQEGVVFHLIGALSEFGKLGVVCIGKTPQKAESLFHETVRVIDKEAEQR